MSICVFLQADRDARPFRPLIHVRCARRSAKSACWCLESALTTSKIIVYSDEMGAGLSADMGETSQRSDLRAFEPAVSGSSRVLNGRCRAGAACLGHSRPRRLHTLQDGLPPSAIIPVAHGDGLRAMLRGRRRKSREQEASARPLRRVPPQSRVITNSHVPHSNR